jgi:hypothetical protein
VPKTDMSHFSVFNASRNPIGPPPNESSVSSLQSSLSLESKYINGVLGPATEPSYSLVDQTLRGIVCAH